MHLTVLRQCNLSKEDIFVSPPPKPTKAVTQSYEKAFLKNFTKVTGKKLQQGGDIFVLKSEVAEL